MLRLRPALLLVAASGSILACVHTHRLVPAAGAPVEPGNPRVADQNVEGVHLRVDSSAWHAGPVRDALSPVHVQIENGSDHPLRIAYSDFTLSRGKGFRLQALPPFQVAVQNASSAVVPEYAWGGFWLAPWDARFFHPGLPVWSGGLPFDAGYDVGRGGDWPAGLPDQTVLRRALPEGVADPGGHVSGFLYFPDQPKGESVTFVASLVDAATNHAFGTVEIPFQVK